MSLSQPEENSMAEYQNLFTQVQVTGPAQMGVPLGPGNSPRTGDSRFSCT
jgi:photosynthetic reaction center M subunit